MGTLVPKVKQYLHFPAVSEASKPKVLYPNFKPLNFSSATAKGKTTPL